MTNIAALVLLAFSVVAAGCGALTERPPPEEPTAPVAQVEPTAPVVQEKPTAPVAQVEPTEPVAQVEPTLPVAQVEPTEPVAQAEPTLPVAPEQPEAPVPGDKILDPCGSDRWSTISESDGPGLFRGDWTLEQYIQWSPDGSRILFNGTSTHPWSPVALYAVDPAGSSIDKVVNVPNSREFHKLFAPASDGFSLLRKIWDIPGRDQIWGSGGSTISFDISPDSSRVVYSTCAFTRAADDDKRFSEEWAYYPQIVVADLEAPEEGGPENGGANWIYNYEIVVSDLDGTDVKRLTENIRFDNYPAWSPDGTRIAFSSGDRSLTIYTVATDSFYKIDLPQWSSSLSPVWAPDGDRIAFAAGASVYTVGVDGSGLAKVTDAASAPAWSPDGERIAVVVPGPEDGVALYTFAADGSDAVMVSNDLPEPWYKPVKPWMGNLSWSPDGSQILLRGFAHRVPLDGSPAIGDPFWQWDPMDSAWSPDGSEIAMRLYEHSSEWRRTMPAPVLVYVAGRDESGLRALAEVFGSYYENEIRVVERGDDS